MKNKSHIDQQKNALIQEALNIAAELVKYDKLAEAEAVYKGILQESPLNGAALYNLGALAHRRFDFTAAEGWFEKALALNPADHELAAALGIVKMEMGKNAQAAPLLEKAMRKNPTAEVMYWQSTLLLEDGKIADATALVREVVRKNPSHINALYNLAITETFKSESDPVLDLMLRHDKNPENITLENRTKLKFALGKAFFDLKDFDRAFAFYAEGNKMQRASMTYYPGWVENYFDNIAKLFTPERIKTMRGHGNPSEKPIFIVGMPRSGSTLIEQILASHPDVHGGQEITTFIDSTPLVKNPDLPPKIDPNEKTIHQGLLDTLNGAAFDKIGADYLAAIEKLSPGAKRFTDKMLFNFIWLGVIRAALPNAKIIHASRDPVDIGLSIYRQHFTRPIGFAYDLADIGQYIKGYQKLMRHWENVFEGEFIEMNYETIVADTETQARRMLSFCHLEWDDNVLKFYETTRKVNTASLTQVRRPIYKDSVKGWQKFEKYLGPLIETLNQPEK